MLLDNTPDYVFALCGAALSGSVIAGLNFTRHGEHLARDIVHTDLQLVITEPRHEDQLAAALDGLDLPGGVLVSDRFADDDDPPTRGASLEARAGVGAAPPRPSERGREADVDDLWVLLFTSGTSAAPKAVRCTQRRLLTTGNRMAMMLELTPDDVGYSAMPLFHTNSLMSGLAPALVAGASLSLARRFSASGFLPDVRRYGATWFNYTGKLLTYLLATPPRDDDADNTLRVAFGNEGSPQVVEEAATRFGVRVIDVFGSTEGAIALDRTAQPPPDVHRAAASGDHGGRRGRPRGAAGPVRLRRPAPQRGPLRGRDRQHARGRARSRATTATTRRCSARPVTVGTGAAISPTWTTRAGSTSPAAPPTGCGSTARASRRRRSRRSSGVTPTSCWPRSTACPTPTPGDQVMAALVLREGAAFDRARFASWLDGQADLSPKWRPRFVRLSAALPTTPTNKILTRTLVHEKFRLDRVGGDPLYVRGRGAAAFGPFDEPAESALRAAFTAAGRDAAWEL